MSLVHRQRQKQKEQELLSLSQAVVGSEETGLQLQKALGALYPWLDIEEGQTEDEMREVLEEEAQKAYKVRLL